MPIQLAENTVVAGRFRLRERIGRGGTGSVWRATHLGLDTPCAVRFIDGDLAQDPDAEARFENEATAVAQLRSPHVVQVLDHGVCDGTPYIAMELLDGEDLGKRLARLGRTPALDLDVIVAQVCRALTKAHAMQILHGDLQPDNVFLVRDDDREIAKVIGFRIAKSTAPSATIGTGDYYRSPEQVEGTKAVNLRSDLWSLAVIVYRCLTGALPFESESLDDLRARIVTRPLPLPSQVTEVPSGFDEWWARAAARDPGERFQSAKELAESLHAVLNASPAARAPARPGWKVAPADTSPKSGSDSRSAREMTPAPPVAAPGNAATGSTATAVAQTRSTRPVPSRRQALAILGGSVALFVLVAGGGVMAVRNKVAPPTPIGPSPSAAAVMTATATAEAPPSLSAPPPSPPATTEVTIEPTTPAASATPEPNPSALTASPEAKGHAAAPEQAEVARTPNELHHSRAHGPKVPPASTASTASTSSTSATPSTTSTAATTPKPPPSSTASQDLGF